MKVVPNRLRIGAVIAGVAIVAFGIAHISSRSHAGSAPNLPSSQLPTAEPRLLDGVAGSVATYRITWRRDVRIDGKSAHAFVAGTLRIVAHRDPHGAVVLAVSLPALDRIESDWPAADGALRSSAAALLFREDHALADIGFSTTTTPLGRLVLRPLLTELAAVLASVRGVAVVDTPNGRAREHREADGRMRRVRYEDLDVVDDAPVRADVVPSVSSSAQVTATEDRLESEETVDVDERALSFHSETKLEAILAGRGSEPASPPPSFTPSAAASNRRFIGITKESGSALVDRYAHGDLATREALFELLALAGAPDMQASLTTLLDQAGRDDEKSFAALVAHLARLRSPTAATAKWIARAHDARTGTPAGDAVIGVTGEIARGVSKTDSAVGEELIDRLERDLAAARTPARRAMIIGALGDAAHARSAGVLLRYAHDPSDDVRVAVARALRTMDGDAVVDALIGLLRDRSVVVARAAIDSLIFRPIDDKRDDVRRAVAARGDLDEKTRERVNEWLAE